ncbi:uncharacterized protein [Periplaneta americana]|uniref:uncharacterized protein n=1 Tax=Periplaneta americana TaxID=6978 RepID=UPI0037E7E444
MMRLSLVKDSGHKLSPQSDVREEDTGEGHIMAQANVQEERRSTDAATQTGESSISEDLMPTKSPIVIRTALEKAITNYCSTSTNLDEDDRGSSSGPAGKMTEAATQTSCQNFYVEPVVIVLTQASTQTMESSISKGGLGTIDKKLAKPMMVYAATQTSSSDHLAESDSRQAEWEEPISEKEPSRRWTRRQRDIEQPRQGQENIKHIHIVEHDQSL